jgi:hypothetical protein
MKCTLPEPDRGGWDSRDYYDDVITELWQVLGFVENLRFAEKEFAKEKIKQNRDGEKLAELHDKILELQNEIDEWFRTLNGEDQ